jgi:hypothetical protein
MLITETSFPSVKPHEISGPVLNRRTRLDFVKQEMKAKELDS